MTARKLKPFRFSEIEADVLAYLADRDAGGNQSQLLRDLIEEAAYLAMRRADPPVLPSHLRDMAADSHGHEAILGTFIRWCRAKESEPGHFFEWLQQDGTEYVIPRYLDPISVKWDLAQERSVPIEVYLATEAIEEAQALRDLEQRGE